MTLATYFRSLLRSDQQPPCPVSTVGAFWHSPLLALSSGETHKQELAAEAQAHRRRAYELGSKLAVLQRQLESQVASLARQAPAAAAGEQVRLAQRVSELEAALPSFDVWAIGVILFELCDCVPFLYVSGRFSISVLNFS